MDEDESTPRKNRFGGNTKLTIDTSNLLPNDSNQAFTPDTTLNDSSSSTNNDGPTSPINHGKKRRRRKANQIERKYSCSYPGCKKAYGSEGSLNQHSRLKHRTMSLDRTPPCHQPQLSPLLPVIAAGFTNKSPLLAPSLLLSQRESNVSIPLIDGRREASKSFCYGSLSTVPELKTDEMVISQDSNSGSRSVPVSPAVSALSEMKISTPKHALLFNNQLVATPPRVPPPLMLDDFSPVATEPKTINRTSPLSPLENFLEMDSFESNDSVPADEKDIMDYLFSLDNSETQVERQELDGYSNKEMLNVMFEWTGGLDKESVSMNYWDETTSGSNTLPPAS